MEEAFNSFYRTLNKDKFKYFIRGDAYCVYYDDIANLPDNLKPKSTEKRSVVRLQNIDNIVKDLLLHKKIPVEEYTDYKLTRKGAPGDLNDFLDLCISETITPTVFAVYLSENNKIDVSFIKDSKIWRTEFYDDDLFCNLFSLCSSNNCIEILYTVPSLERIFNGWGISSLLFKGESSVDMLKRYLKVDADVFTFVKENCCLINIADFDLVDFGLETQQGKRLLNQWLRIPSTDQKEIEKRLDFVEAFAKLPISVHGFGDLKRTISRIHTKSITREESVRLCQVLSRIDGLISELSHNRIEIVETHFIKPLQSLRTVFLPLINEIKEKIDFNTSRIHLHLSEELSALESVRFEILHDVEKEFLRVRKDYPKVSFSSKLFKISRNDYNQSDFDTKKYVVSSVLKTGVTFVTKTLSELNEKISGLESEISKVETRIMTGLINTLMNFTASFETFNYLISLIDIYKAFSEKTKSGMYSRPVFSESKYEFSGLFHPMIEHKDCILNDVSFTRNVCVLTGPNMGGKSTFLKALSMASLYAQIGCYVPAKKAILPIFDRIFLRIGARDCSSQKMSTFMVEMSELNRILRTATSKSLVLIDELGRGTSAIDGLSLALAVRDYLIDLKPMVVMATHFSELGNEFTMNKKMQVDGNILLYKVVDGICDLSFGINVAEIAKFPEEVLLNAKRYLSN